MSLLHRVKESIKQRHEKSKQEKNERKAIDREAQAKARQEYLKTYRQERIKAATLSVRAKAKTQHEPAWDIFKGAFDTLATKVSVILASMGNPSSATEQLQQKYTHEIYVERKGHAKYDKVDWQQNYAGWQARQDKDWQQSFEFEPVPLDVYKQYDEMRLALVDELFTLISDAMVENEALRTIRRMQEIDVDFLEIIKAKGMLDSNWFEKPECHKYRKF